MEFEPELYSIYDSFFLSHRPLFHVLFQHIDLRLAYYLLYI